MFNEGEEILSLRTFGGMTDDLLERVISMGKELAKRVFYLINHELLACSVCFIHYFFLGTDEHEDCNPLRCGVPCCRTLPSLQLEPIQEVQCCETERRAGSEAEGGVPEVPGGATPEEVDAKEGNDDVDLTSASVLSRTLLASLAVISSVRRSPSSIT